MDVFCAKCGEPWDYYGLVHGGDMEPEDAWRFRCGEGCPSCGFGTTCTTCHGGGRHEENSRCTLCFGKGIMLGWSPSRSTGQYRAGAWYVGYEPNVHDMTGSAVVREERGFESRDGHVRQAWLRCPHADEHPACPACGGDGRFQYPKDLDELAFDAAVSETEASDEDPYLILRRRALEP